MNLAKVALADEILDGKVIVVDSQGLCFVHDRAIYKGRG